MEAEQLMRLAIDIARQGLAAGQSPFGCAIAVDDRVVACQHNTVWKTTDATAHAEINAIRQANQQFGSIHLPGAIVATTCEPCPMCMAALHWARVDTVYYGATITDAADAGFNELFLPAQALVAQGGSDVELIADLLREECRQLFALWQQNQGRSY